LVVCANRGSFDQHRRDLKDVLMKFLNVPMGCKTKGIPEALPSLTSEAELLSWTG
jgi:hypothetical protein